MIDKVKMLMDKLDPTMRMEIISMYTEWAKPKAPSKNVEKLGKVFAKLKPEEQSEFLSTIGKVNGWDSDQSYSE